MTIELKARLHDIQLEYLARTYQEGFKSGAFYGVAISSVVITALILFVAVITR